MNTSDLFGFVKRVTILTLILFSPGKQLRADVDVDLDADLDVEIDEMRIVPPTNIEKIPGPVRIANYLYNQLPEDKEWSKPLPEGNGKGNRIYRIDAEVDEMRIVPRSPIDNYVIHQFPEDKKGLEALSEGIKKGDSIFQYGNWYGPGWWGGGTDKDKPGNMAPVDELDAAAQRHDYGYLVAEKMGKIYGKAEEYRLKAIADAIAVEDARKLDPDPSKWNPPAADPEKASRYRDRIITGFHYESMAYGLGDEVGRGINWVRSPVESWEMSDHNQKLDREDFERHVKIHIDHWERTEKSTEDAKPDLEGSPRAEDVDSAQDAEDTSVPGAKDDSPAGNEQAPDSSGKDQGIGTDDDDRKPADDKSDASESSPDGDDDSDTADSDKLDDDGLQHGAPSGDESDAYEDGARVVDDDGTEYQKGPDGSWQETGDKYDPVTKEQKDAWDREIEDARRKLKDHEASSGGSDPGSDDSDGNIIDNYADNYQEKQKSRSETSADNMDLNQQIKSSSTAGDQQIYDARKIVSSAGRDAKDIKDASSAKTAQKERDDSWGNTLGNAVGDGVQQGLENFASTFGSEAAEDAANQIFEGGKKTKAAPSGGAVAGVAPASGGSRAAPQPGGGQGSSGGGSAGAPAGSGGVPSDSGEQDGTGDSEGGVAADGDGLAEQLVKEAATMPSDKDDDFDKTGDTVTVKEDASANDGGGTANTGSSASGGFAKGHQDRTINGSGALAGKTVAGVTVKLSYNAYRIPDSFSIIYDGKSLGGSGMTSGSGSISGKSAGSSSSVTIRVLSNQEKKTTKWNWSAEVTFHTK